MRQMICNDTEYFGLKIDEQKNNVVVNKRIFNEDSKTKAFYSYNEEIMTALDTVS